MLVNAAVETEHVRRVGATVLGAANVTTDELPMLGSEDFAYYTQAHL